MVAGIRTAIYRNKHKSSSPTWLFLHGISGDHHGLMPLAYELRHEVNIVIVELPGHGLSAMPKNTSIEWLEEWSMSLLKALDKKEIIIDKIIAHSFSCIPATIMTKSYEGSVVFMNVVARPAWFYTAYARGISYFRAVLAICINFVPFSFFAGRVATPGI